MRVRWPQGNAVVLALLRSPVHRVLSGLALELRYSGRRSGRQFALPVQYARDGNRLVVWPQGAERKTWWRNFEIPRPVAVRLAGRVVRGTARVVAPGDADYAAARAAYGRKWRRLEPRLSGPCVVILLDR